MHERYTITGIIHTMTKIVSKLATSRTDRSIFEVVEKIITAQNMPYDCIVQEKDMRVTRNTVTIKHNYN